MKIHQFAAGAILAAAPLAPLAFESAPVHASPLEYTSALTASFSEQNVCTYTVPKNVGKWTIEHSTGLKVNAIATEMGVTVGKLTLEKAVLDICIGNGVHDEKTNKSDLNSSTTITTEPNNMPTTLIPVTVPQTDKICAYNVISDKETANLLGVSGKTGNALCSLVVDFQKQNRISANGVVGKATADKLITQSPNACNIYGSAILDCFLGVEKTGYLGTLYTIENGKVVATMPARFGNPTLNKGEATPEGAFKINRAIKGPHAGSLCIEAKTCMDNPLYFAGENGGISIHGTTNPQSPLGSHGCIGVSNANSDLTFESYDKHGVKTVVVIDFQRTDKAK